MRNERETQNRVIKVLKEELGYINIVFKAKARNDLKFINGKNKDVLIRIK